MLNESWRIHAAYTINFYNGNRRNIIPLYLPRCLLLLYLKYRIYFFPKKFRQLFLIQLIENLYGNEIEPVVTVKEVALDAKASFFSIRQNVGLKRISATIGMIDFKG